MTRTPPQITRPAYAIASVDNALRLVQMLRDGGRVRVSDAADELRIAPSTVHRLLAMLVYRGFAIRDESRCYLPGPALGAPPTTSTWTRTLRDACRPYLEILAQQTGETANLLFRMGTKVRFLDSVESSNILRVADRTGAVLEAARASGGKVLLAELDELSLERLYRSRAAELANNALSDTEFARLRRDLAAVRRDGFALNREETESGVCALGMAIHDARSFPVASFSIAMPSGRSDKLVDPDLQRLAAQVRGDIEDTLALMGGPARASR